MTHQPLKRRLPGTTCRSFPALVDRGLLDDALAAYEASMNFVYLLDGVTVNAIPSTETVWITRHGKTVVCDASRAYAMERVRLASGTSWEVL